jgi:Tfp pilus assembly protein PilZ
VSQQGNFFAYWLTALVARADPNVGGRPTSPNQWQTGIAEGGRFSERQLIIARRCDNARLGTMATTSQGTVGTSHAVSLARSAREKLASALAELQGEGVPPRLVDNAAGVARAMGLLLKYEQTGEPSLTEAALSAVRDALGALQSLHAHPAAERATGLVAGSLALIHSLGELAQLHGQSATIAETRDPVPEKSPRSSDDMDTVRLGRRARSPDSSDGLSYVEPPAWLREERPANEQQAASQPDEPQRRANPREGATGATSTKDAPAERPSTRAAKRKKHAEQDVVEAALGAHSATNFYRGLSSPDVIENGGLFIATYQVRRLGETLSLVVTLPGGHEFMARGVVRWSRELPRAASMNPDAPPGLGVKFIEIPETARRLVTRYVNNREPLLHDDG